MVTVLEWYQVTPYVVPQWFGMPLETIVEAYASGPEAVSGIIQGQIGLQGPKGEQGDVSLAQLNTGLATKANVVHPHAIADVTGLASRLDEIDTKAPVNSPALTGTPTAPTPAQSSNSQQIATTAFVQAALAAGLSVPANHVHVVADITGLQAILDAKAASASPALTGTPTAPTATPGTSSTQIATTAFVSGAVSAAIANAAASGHQHPISDISGLVAALAALAPINNAALTGAPTAPTPAADSNNTRVATTEFVQNGLAGKADLDHQHPISEVDGLQTELDGKFDKTGGTVNGSLAVRAASPQMELLRANGSRASRFRIIEATNDLVIEALDVTGTTTSTTLTLDGDANGALINGSQILTAANYNAYALPIAGGNLTGNLTINNAEVITAANVSTYLPTATNSWFSHVGTGLETVFALPSAPASAAAVFVAVSGVMQAPSDYYVSGSNLVFNTPPPLGTAIAGFVTTTAVVSVNVPSDFSVSYGKLDGNVQSLIDGKLDKTGGILTGDVLVSAGRDIQFTSSPANPGGLVFRREDATVGGLVQFDAAGGQLKIASADPTGAEKNVLTISTGNPNQVLLNGRNIISDNSIFYVDFQGSNSFTLTAIPADVRRLTIHGYNLSSNSTSNLQLRIGGSTQIDTTGYNGVTSRIAAAAVATTVMSAAFVVADAIAAANIYSTKIVIERLGSTQRYSITCNTSTQSGTVVQHVSHCIKSLDVDDFITRAQLFWATSTHLFDGNPNLVCTYEF